MTYVYTHYIYIYIYIYIYHIIQVGYRSADEKLSSRGVGSNVASKTVSDHVFCILAKDTMTNLTDYLEMESDRLFQRKIRWTNKHCAACQPRLGRSALLCLSHLRLTFVAFPFRANLSCNTSVLAKGRFSLQLVA